MISDWYKVTQASSCLGLISYFGALIFLCLLVSIPSLAPDLLKSISLVLLGISGKKNFEDL